MEDLNPTLRLIMSLREGLERGESLRHSLEQFIQHERGELVSRLQKWWFHHNRHHGQETEGFSISQQAVLLILERGLQGETIGPALIHLEREVAEKCELEAEEFAQTLSLKCLVPLLLLIFPAYLIILLGPLVEELLRSLNQ